MTKEVEDLILHKEYADLTVAEKGVVSEWVADEEAFAEMKWFLNETKATFAANKIQPTEKLKERVMARLEHKEKRAFWLSSLGGVLFPEGRKFYQKPAFQLGIAALVIVGAVFFIRPFSEEKQNLVLNEVEQEMDRIESDEVSQESNDQGDEQALPPEEEVNQQREVLNIGENKADGNAQVSNEMNGAPEAPVLYEVDMEVEKFQDVMEETQSYALEEPSPVIEDAEEDFKAYEMDDRMEERTQEEEETLVDEMLAVEKQKMESDQNEMTTRDKKDRGRRLNDSAVVTSESVNIQLTSPANTDAYYNSGASTDLEAVAFKETLVPKSLHIDQTKELNDLFFIEE